MTPFGTKLLELRQLRKISHDQLAIKLKLSAAELSAWQNGLNGQPSLVMLFQIERAMQLTPYEIADLKQAVRFSAPEVTIRTQGLGLAAIELAHLFASRLARLPEKSVSAIRKILDKAGE